MKMGGMPLTDVCQEVKPYGNECCESKFRRHLSCLCFFNTDRRIWRPATEHKLIPIKILFFLNTCVQLFKIGTWQNSHWKQARGFSPVDGRVRWIWRHDKSDPIRSTPETLKQNNKSKLNGGLWEASHLETLPILRLKRGKFQCQFLKKISETYWINVK